LTCAGHKISRLYDWVNIHVYTLSMPMKGNEWQ